jgi:hypothetical protein
MPLGRSREPRAPSLGDDDAVDRIMAQDDPWQHQDDCEKQASKTLAVLAGAMAPEEPERQARARIDGGDEGRESRGAWSWWKGTVSRGLYRHRVVDDCHCRRERGCLVVDLTPSSERMAR